MHMNKVELIAAVAEKTGITKKEAENIITAFTDIVTEALAKGEKVSLVGFGTFETKTRASREGINPRTKEKIMIPASKTPDSRGKVLKESVK
jgi:DNA-binding protein HU-beta